LHHCLLIAAYILFAVEPLFGFSFKLLWPVFLTLPFALIQIYWFRNIALGAKPIWTLITANAIAILNDGLFFDPGFLVALNVRVSSTHPSDEARRQLLSQLSGPFESISLGLKEISS